MRHLKRTVARRMLRHSSHGRIQKQQARETRRAAPGIARSCREGRRVPAVAETPSCRVGRGGSPSGPRDRLGPAGARIPDRARRLLGPAGEGSAPGRASPSPTRLAGHGAGRGRGRMPPARAAPTRVPPRWRYASRHDVAGRCRHARRGRCRSGARTRSADCTCGRQRLRYLPAVSMSARSDG
jgi:hypothetical protein